MTNDLCPKCGGTGRAKAPKGVSQIRFCQSCNGTGKKCSCNLPKPEEVHLGKTYSYDPNCPVHGTSDGPGYTKDEDGFVTLDEPHGSRTEGGLREQFRKAIRHYHNYLGTSDTQVEKDLDHLVSIAQSRERTVREEAVLGFLKGTGIESAGVSDQELGNRIRVKKRQMDAEKYAALKEKGDDGE